MQPKKQDVGMESLEEIMEFMDEQMLNKAMSKMKKPNEQEIVAQSESDDDFEISQPVPMAEEKAEDEDMDPDMLAKLMEQYESEMA